jgi:LysM repeat protein
MSNIVVVLDPGHTQNYNKGVLPGYFEGNMTLDLAQRLKAALERYGVTVYLTRTTGGENPALAARGKLAITKKANLFLSLHSDAAGSPTVGCVTVIRSLQRQTSVAFGKQLAAAVSNVMGTKLSTYAGADAGVWTRVYPGYSSVDYYGVIRAAVGAGSVVDAAYLVEHGHHTNPHDCNILNTADGRQRIADAEAAVIAAHYGLSVASTPVPEPAAAAGKTYTVRPGDSWWRIAAQQLGSGLKCNALAKANGKSIYSTIHPGDVLTLPQ